MCWGKPSSDDSQKENQGANRAHSKVFSSPNFEPALDVRLGHLGHILGRRTEAVASAPACCQRWQHAATKPQISPHRAGTGAFCLAGSRLDAGAAVGLDGRAAERGG